MLFEVFDEGALCGFTIFVGSVASVGGEDWCGFRVWISVFFRCIGFSFFVASLEVVVFSGLASWCSFSVPTSLVDVAGAIRSRVVYFRRNMRLNI